ncbi:MAG: VOC family protein [Chloroflexi bacterium]|nr:VOC family protein [Chloroflexota bacterium]
MLSDRPAFSSFSADDIAAARSFYEGTLGLTVTEENGMLMLDLAGNQRVLIYPKEDHAPATFTVLNFEVDDIEASVDELSGHGVAFQRYEGFAQDDRGIMRGFGPPIAWITDPAGNVLALIQSGG